MGDFIWNFVPARVQEYLFGFGLLFSTVFIFVVIIYNIIARRHEFRAHGVIIPEYEPPRGLPPIALSQVLDGKIELRDIVAEIIDLSVKGYIEIKKDNDTIVFYRI